MTHRTWRFSRPCPLRVGENRKSLWFTESVIMMLKIGDVLSLELKESDKLEKYRCKLVEKKGQYIYIDYPVNTVTNKTAFFLDGTQIKCSFVDQDGAVYAFDSEILGRFKQKIPMLILSYPGKEHLIKIQRRQYVRIETSIDIAIHSPHSEFKPIVTVTDDFSAGGASVILPNSVGFRSGMEIDCWIVLPLQNGDYHYFTFPSKIVRIIPLDDNRSKISIQFLAITSQQRQTLLRFCFDRQLLMRRTK